MGKIKCESHFSHPHPLNLISLFENPNLASPSSSCSGCKLKPSGIIYSCTLCPTFFLHRQCFQMPHKITHPFHEDHALTLLPKPAYAGGEFSCDACAHHGAGFSYHCKPCGLDLHILCAAAPLSVTTASHPHTLRLTFGSPYNTKNFACDVCGGVGSDHWLYRCATCGFDAHLKCATDHGGEGMHPPAAQPPPLVGGAAFGVPAGGVYGQNYNLDVQAMAMQMIQNNSAMCQAMLANAGGGFGGGVGGDRSLQQMMQVMSALNRGGGGLDSLQSLLGNGGLDFLNVGGGLDFLGGLGGFL